MPDPELQSLNDIIKAWQNGVTKEKFVALGKELLDLVAQTEIKLLQRVDSSIVNQDRKIDALGESLNSRVDKGLEDIKKATDTSYRTLRERSIEAMNAVLARMGFEQRFRAKVDEIDAKIAEIPDTQTLVEETASKVDTSPETLRDKLESLEGDERIDVSAIKGIEELTKSPVKGSGGSSSVFGSVGHSPLHESFTMNGSDISVTLTQGVAAQGNAIFVRMQGQLLDMTTHYTVNGNTVNFTFTPDADVIISCTYWP